MSYYGTSNELIEQDLKDIAFTKVRQTPFPDGMLVPVIIRLRPDRFGTVWNKLTANQSSISPQSLEAKSIDEEEDFFSIKGLSLKNVLDAILQESNAFDLFEKEIPNSKFSETSQPADVQRKIHDNHCERNIIERTSKLDLLNGIATKLDAVSIRNIHNAQLGNQVGIMEMAYDRPLQEYLDISPALIGVSDMAWNLGHTGSGIRVAVLDSGCDIKHPDLQDRVVLSRDFTGQGTDNTDVSDTSGHGTHVAGTIAGTGAASNGRLKGIAPGCQLLIGRVLHPMSRQLSNTIEGIQWAAENNADVINMSLGTDRPKDGSDPLSVAVQNAINTYGVNIVVAAGNAGALLNNEREIIGRKRSSIGTPAACLSCITVGAVKFDRNTRRVLVAEFSSIGPRMVPGSGDTKEDFINIKPDICAPGVDILAARAKDMEFKQARDPNRHTNNVPAGFEEHYHFKSGTSMATPIVSGSIALALEAFKKANNIADENQWRAVKQTPIEDCLNFAYFIKKALFETAMPLAPEQGYDVPGLNKSIVSGVGLIRVDRFIPRVVGQPRPYVMQQQRPYVMQQQQQPSVPPPTGFSFFRYWLERGREPGNWWR